MKKLALVILNILIVVTAKSQSYELLLLSPTKETIVGEALTFQLIIHQADRLAIYSPGDFDIQSNYQFTNSFIVVPKKKGPLQIGPYVVNINGKQLKSNQITLNVIKKTFREDELEVDVPDKCKKDEIFELVLTSHKTPINDITIKKNSSYVVTSTSRLSSTNTDNGQVTVVYQTTFKIKFLKEG